MAASFRGRRVIWATPGEKEGIYRIKKEKSVNNTQYVVQRCEKYILKTERYRGNIVCITALDKGVQRR